MNFKKIATLSLSAVIGACSLAFAVGPTVGASANTLTSSDAPFDEWGYLDATGTAKYNAFGPYRFNYYSPYSNLVYGVDIPDSYGGPPNEWDTTANYGVFDYLLYSNNIGLFGAKIVDFVTIEDISCINFQMTSDLFWLDSYKEYYFMADCPCKVDLFVWYDDVDAPDGERTFTRFNQDYEEWVYSDGSYTLDVYNMLSGFVDEVESEYDFLNDDGVRLVRTFTMTFTPTEDMGTIAVLPLITVGEPITLREASVFKHTQLSVPATSTEVIPDDFFGWIFDAVGSFLDTEFLPDVSFGKLILIALGFVVFGLGIKIAFGG